MGQEKASFYSLSLGGEFKNRQGELGQPGMFPVPDNFRSDYCTDHHLRDACV